MRESSNYNDSLIKEIDNSRRLDTSKKSYIDGSIITKNISKE